MIGRKVWRSPSVLLTICCFGVGLISGVVRGVALGGRVSAGGGPGETVEPLPQNLGDEVEEGDGGEVMGAGGNRVKRSRDVQQFCGYRLLDALRSVCDRNFVGFTRRSDPSFLRDSNNNGLEGMSGEDIGIFGGNPWEIAFMTLEGTGGGGNQAVGGDNSLWGLEGNQGLDYLVESQQQQLNQQPIFGRNSAAGGVGRGSSSPVGMSSSSAGSKAFALKLLAEPPKTHQRFRRNIIDECCKKPCAMNQMLKYCAITAVGKRSF